MEEERMVLDHEPKPGYRPAFYAALTAAITYLVIIFFMSV